VAIQAKCALTSEAGELDSHINAVTKAKQPTVLKRWAALAVATSTRVLHSVLVLCYFLHPRSYAMGSLRACDADDFFVIRLICFHPRSVLTRVCSIVASASRLIVLPVAFFILAISPSAAVTWREAIAVVKSNSKAMSEKADAMGYPISLGTAINGYRVPEHYCAILGRMLGKAGAIKHLEFEPPKVSSDGYEFRLEALSLDNWVAVAENVLRLSEPQRVKIWDLDCVGHLDVPVSEYIGSATSGTFYAVVNDGYVLRIIGDVEVGFADKVAAALSENPSVEVVALGSAGGIVSEALKAGIEIRTRRLKTTLWNNCYSACPLVFLAGVDRMIWSPYPELGFHQISVGQRAIPEDDPLYSVVRDYAASMGADGDEVLRQMLAAAPSSMNVPELQLLCDAKIALWVQRAC
jgi:hypothetical protein